MYCVWPGVEVNPEKQGLKQLRIGAAEIAVEGCRSESRKQGLKPEYGRRIAIIAAPL